MPDGQQLYMDISYHPLAEVSIDDLADYPFPKGNDPTRFSDVVITLRLSNQPNIIEVNGSYAASWNRSTPGAKTKGNAADIRQIRSLIGK